MKEKKCKAQLNSLLSEFDLHLMGHLKLNGEIIPVYLQNVARGFLHSGCLPRDRVSGLAWKLMVIKIGHRVSLADCLSGTVQ